ncbi:MAG: hypothetical protein AAB582_03375 [Patescibacteria group bacterium]
MPLSFQEPVDPKSKGYRTYAITSAVCFVAALIIGGLGFGYLMLKAFHVV